MNICCDPLIPSNYFVCMQNEKEKQKRNFVMFKNTNFVMFLGEKWLKIPPEKIKVLLSDHYRQTIIIWLQFLFWILKVLIILIIITLKGFGSI